MYKKKNVDPTKSQWNNNSTCLGLIEHQCSFGFPDINLKPGSLQLVLMFLIFDFLEYISTLPQYITVLKISKEMIYQLYYIYIYLLFSFPGYH